MTVHDALDPVTLAVIEAKLDYVTREMGIIMTRTARSPIFSQSHDFSCFITDGTGQLIAQADGLPIHTGGGGFAVRAIRAYWGDDIAPGDTFILNDPYVAGGNHLPDWTVATPVFAGEAVVAFACNRAHQIDIGGGAAGTYNPKAQEIFDEGLRIPTVKLYERGRLRRDVLDFITLNTRFPEIVAGDVGSMIGSTRIAEQRILEMCEEYGRAEFVRYCDALLDYGERVMRDAIAAIPDGVYEAADYMNNDGVSDRRVKVAVRVTVQGSDVTVDFTGTDPQLRSYKNSSVANTYSAVYMAIGTLLDPTLPHNEGSYRMVTVIAPRGTVVNPEPPAPLTYSTTYPAHEIIHAVWRALESALPANAPAGWGKTCHPITSGTRADGSRYVMYHFGAFPGAGAVRGRDGFDEIGLLVSLGGLVIPNLEVYEQIYPVHFLKQEFRRDGGGAGQFRGGTGVEYIARMMGEGRYILRGEGVRTPTGFGVCGGKAGQPGVTVINHGSEGERHLSQCDIIDLPPCTLHIQTPGGGGWGDPKRRDREAVRLDVENGLVSVAAARDEYGVVIDPEEIQRNTRSSHG